MREQSLKSCKQITLLLLICGLHGIKSQNILYNINCNDEDKSFYFENSKDGECYVKCPE